MNNFISRVKDIYKQYYGSFIVSILATITMLVLTLVSYLSSYDSFYIVFILFYLFIIIVRTINFTISKLNKFDDYHKAAIINPMITGVLMIVSNFSFVISLLIIINNKPLINFPSSTLIYGYAAYAFYKMGSAIYNIVNGLKAQNNCVLSLSAISMESALFTILSLAVNLDGRFGSGDSSNIVLIEYIILACSGAINLIFAAYLIVISVKKLLKKN